MKISFLLSNLKKVLPMAAFSLLIFLAHLNTAAKTVDEYRKNIDSARNSVEKLLDYEDEADDGEPNVRDVGKAVAEIKKNLTADKIEWQGAAVETDYSWFIQSLNEYSIEKSSEKRGRILTSLDQRLKALQLKLKALDSAAVSNHSKDEDKQKLAEILKREEYQKPEPKTENILQKWMQQIEDWIENLFPKSNIQPGESNGFKNFSVVLQILLYAVIAAVIGFLLYKFAPFLLKKYKRREKREKKDRVIFGERIAADETPENLFDEAERLAREGNVRAAIRKGYVAVLCELSDRKMIGLARHKTNRDYLRDVRGRREIYENMTGLTASFERHWYGFQPAETDDWNNFRREYQSITNDKLRITN